MKRYIVIAAYVLGFTLAALAHSSAGWNEKGAAHHREYSGSGGGQWSGGHRGR